MKKVRTKGTRASVASRAARNARRTPAAAAAENPGRRLRMTRQRQVILEELSSVTSHPTADEVYELVRRRLPRISLGTVYRNLELLSDSGVIQKLELGGTQRRYDGNAKKHYHIRCPICGCVFDLPVKPLKRLSRIERAAERATGCEIVGHRLEFIGKCPHCKPATEGSHG